MEPTPDALQLAQPSRSAPPSRGSVALVLAAGILFGTAGTARAVAAPSASNVSVGGLRVLVGGLALLVAIPRLGGSRSRTLSLWRRPAVVLMAVAAALYQVCFFAAVGTVGVALGTLVAVGSAPILAGMLGWAVLGHRPTGVWIAATGLAVSGLALLSAEAVTGPGSGIGVLLALGAGLSSAVYNVATKPVLDAGAQPTELTAAAFTLAGLLLLPGLLTQPLEWLLTPGGIGLALYLGAVTAALANSWLARGVHGLGPGPASTLVLADPVTATALGVVVLHELVTVPMTIGIGLVLVGLVLQAAAPRRSADPASVRRSSPELVAQLRRVRPGRS